MIIAYTGMPNSGKSYALVYRADKAMRQGRTVFCNFPLKGTFQITLDDLCNYQFPEGSVVLIDEAGRWFNSHNWKDLPPEIFDLFTMHRHMQMDLFIAVQSFTRVDKSLREVVELVYWARNNPMLPYHKYYGYYDLEKLGSMKRDHHVQHIVFKNKRLRSMYDTHAMKSQFATKPMMPYVRWSFRDKTRFELFKQRLLLPIKKLKHALKKRIRAIKNKTA